MSDFVQQQSVECRFESFDSWVILSPIEQSIKRKIESVGTPLKDWDIQINYGIKTGFNDAFIISTEKRNEILDNCSSEEERTKTAELIRPVIDQLRLLAHLCGYLERMKYRYAEEPIKKGYFETIIAHVEIERRILLVQLRYPALATQQSKHIRSPYYWSAEYTLTDLMELISALHASGAIRKADGTPAELNKLVRTFELLLNVSMQHIMLIDYQ